MNKFKQLWDRKKIQNNTTEYSGEDIYRVVRSQLKNPKIMPLDSKYLVPTTEAFRDVLKNNVVNECQYIAEYFDCESFAFLFKALATLNYHINSIGVCISYQSRHAFNIVITVGSNKSLKLWVMEPQNDKLWVPQNGKREKYITEDQTILI